MRLLPNREVATVQAWLSDHPGIRIVSRDRGGGYGEAAAKALPEAIQVADRWHLMENASAAFLGAVRRSMRMIRTAIGATTINPELLTCAERLQFNGYLRREETNAAIMALVKDGVPLKEIVRRTGTAVNSLVRSVEARARISSDRGTRKIVKRHVMPCSLFVERQPLPPARQPVDKARQGEGPLIWINAPSSSKASFENEALQRKQLRGATQFMLACRMLIRTMMNDPHLVRNL